MRVNPLITTVKLREMLIKSILVHLIPAIASNIAVTRFWFLIHSPVNNPYQNTNLNGSNLNGPNLNGPNLNPNLKARGGGGGGGGGKSRFSSFYIFDQSCWTRTRRKNRTEI